MRSGSTSIWICSGGRPVRASDPVARSRGLRPSRTIAVRSTSSSPESPASPSDGSFLPSTSDGGRPQSETAAAFHERMVPSGKVASTATSTACSTSRWNCSVGVSSSWSSRFAVSCSSRFTSRIWACAASRWPSLR